MSVVLAGKYHLLRRLGIGGMAEVYLAKCVGAEGFEAIVAIKRVLKGFANDEKFVNLFVAEGLLSARLDHQNIVQVFELARDDDGRPFLVMEVVDGTTLDAVMASGPLPTEVIVFVVGEILRGLAYAHDLPAEGDGVKGLVHRDVSPHNVLLSWQGEVKIADFGLAKVRMASNATATEMIKGKPAYMSPEQANGEPVDGRSDLFAVGVMLWEMLCGRSLFSGVTTQETLARLMFAPIQPPRSLRPEVPEDLEHVTMRLLARARGDRYADAPAALAELTACADHRPDARAMLITTMKERLGATPLDVTAERSKVPRRRQRSLLTTVVVAFAVFGAGAGLLIGVMVARREPQAAVAIDAAVPVALPNYVDAATMTASLERIMARSRTECPWSAKVRLIVKFGVQPDGSVGLIDVHEAPAAAPCIRAVIQRERYAVTRYGFVESQYDFGSGTAP